MKKTILSVLVLAVISSSAFAGSLPAGSYQCQKSAFNSDIIGSYYVRADGTSKKVRIESAEASENGSGVEGCYTTTFTWLSDGKTVSDAYCCPSGSN